MTDRDPHVSLSDIASAVEVRLSAVSNWRSRHDDFPRPVVVDGHERFDAGEIAAWLQRRKIPRNRLRPAESAGASYGERFVAIVDFAIPHVAVDVPAPPVHQESPWARQLWDAVSRLRDTQDVGIARDYVFRLLYLRVSLPAVWAELMAASDWAEARQRITKLTVPRDDGTDVPLFDLVARTDDSQLLEAARLLDRIDFGEGGIESGAPLLGDSLLDNTERALGRSGGFFTPVDVARCLIELLNPNVTDHIYDPFTGSGELLVAAAAYVHRRGESPSGWTVFGQTAHESSWLTAKMNLTLHRVNAEIRLARNVFEDDAFPDRTFDCVVANPPFNVHVHLPPGKTWRFGEPPERSANFAWLQHAVSKLAPGGRAAVIMPDGAGFSEEKRAQAIRAEMVNAGVVECVIGLPAQLFRFTGIRTTIWILRRRGAEPPAGEVLFIDALDLGAMVDRSRRQLSTDETGRIAAEYHRWLSSRASGEFGDSVGFSRAVAYQDIVRDGSILQPSRYVRAAAAADAARDAARLAQLRDELADLDRQADQARGALARQWAAIAEHQPSAGGCIVALSDVCQVLPGPGSIERSGQNQIGTPLVLPRNIRDDRVGHQDLDIVSRDIAAGLARYRLQAGDIVSARVGTLGRYGLITNDQSGWLLGPGCVCFRPRGQIVPGYLTFYLNSPQAYRWLVDHARGSAIQHVTAATLRELPIWLPSIEEQLAVAETLDLFRSAAMTHAEISSTTKELGGLLASMLTSGPGRQ
ncbi:N-6 DNA methylase [Amycolatopsis sp. NPDC051903]|uniref:N-6 DNA methylase n=1 Tax=Amycolatopsis sp. NPDC051903 TaxID=3363936 RepID=UPI0037AC65BB